jgi:hypothetical protein
MNEEDQNDKSAGGSQSKESEPSSLPLSPKQVEAAIDESKLERIIDTLPPEQKQTILREVIFGIIERGSTPKVDPEVVKIAAASVDKDNENKYRFLSQKEANKAEQDKRECELKDKEHDLKVRRFDSQVKMLWPILISLIILIVGCIASGIYLAATGRDTLGFSILSATISAVFAFLGGLGTAHFFKHE